MFLHFVTNDIELLAIAVEVGHVEYGRQAATILGAKAALRAPPPPTAAGCATDLPLRASAMG